MKYFLSILFLIVALLNLLSVFPKQKKIKSNLKIWNEKSAKKFSILQSILCIIASISTYMDYRYVKLAAMVAIVLLSFYLCILMLKWQSNS